MAEALTAQGGRDWDDLPDTIAAEAEMLANGVNGNFVVHPDMTATDRYGYDLEDEAEYNCRILKAGPLLPTVGKIVIKNASLTGPMRVNT